MVREFRIQLFSQYAEYDYSDFQKQRQREADKSLFVKFEYRPWHDKRESLIQGRPIYKDLVYVNVRGAGNKEGVCRPATQADIARFREHYDIFMRRTGEEQLVGTPLVEWPLMPRSRTIPTIRLPSAVCLSVY